MKKGPAFSFSSSDQKALSVLFQARNRLHKCNWALRGYLVLFDLNCLFVGGKCHPMFSSVLRQLYFLTLGSLTTYFLVSFYAQSQNLLFGGQAQTRCARQISRS
jgi:hypothetical protein